MPATSSGQENRGSTVLVLKDPTPRPLDLEKAYSGEGAIAASAPTPRKQETLYEQKKGLMVRASHQVSTLAYTLDKAVTANPPIASREQEVQVAALIELLAGNVHKAMLPAPSAKNGPAQQQASAGAPGELNTSVPLTSQAAELVSLARELEDGVEKLSPDTLSLGVLTKSSEVLELAHALKQRLGAQ